MTKGKFGINNTAIAVIAFVFVALGNPTAVLLVAGFALLAERDEWLNRQAMQALLLNLSYLLVTLVLGWMFSRIVWFFTQVEAYKVAKFFNEADGYVDSAIYVALIVLCILAIIRVMKGKEAKIPILAKMASGNIADALQKTAATVQQHTPQQSAPAQPDSAAQTQFSQAQETTVEHQTTQPAQASTQQGSFCSQCGTPLSADAAFCNECGAKQ